MRDIVSGTAAAMHAEARLTLGGGSSSEEDPHHHPKFDFDETVLAKGVAILCRAVFNSNG